jgi:hypothetical protein
MGKRESWVSRDAGISAVQVQEFMLYLIALHGFGRMYLTFNAHISPHVADSFGGPYVVVIVSLGLFREFENIFGSEVRQEKRIYKKAMLGVQLGWTDRGGKGKSTQENNPELMMYMLGGGWNDWILVQLCCSGAPCLSTCNGSNAEAATSGHCPCPSQ